MKPLRIILVMIEPPLPFRHATTRWSYALLKGLVRRGHRITAFAAPSEPQAIEEVNALFPAPAYDLRCYPYPKRNRFRSKLETLCRPYSYMFSPALRHDLGAELERGVDVLHLQETWAGWLGQSKYDSKTALNFHNLYAIDHPTLSQPSLIFRGLAEKFRMAVQRHAERFLLRRYPMLMTVTPRLRQVAREIAPATPVHVVPLALDLTLYPFLPSDRRPPQSVISLIGSMDWYPSRSAAVRLITRLWPAIRQRVSDAKLRIVGRNARSALSDYLERPDIDIAEDVASTRPYFEDTTVMLYAPERGSGMKVKVLEAFAYGVPVVTTSDGVEGLPAQDDVHAGVCDDDSGLIERAVLLLKDHARQERQRTAGRQLLENCCNAEAALDAVERCYAEIVARNASR